MKSDEFKILKIRQEALIAQFEEAGMVTEEQINTLRNNSEEYDSAIKSLGKKRIPIKNWIIIGLISIIAIIIFIIGSVKAIHAIKNAKTTTKKTVIAATWIISAYITSIGLIALPAYVDLNPLLKLV